MRISKLKTIVVLFLVVVTMMTGCISEKKMNKYVVNHYGETISAKKIKSDYIAVTSSLITDDPVPSVSTKKTKKVLP